MTTKRQLVLLFVVLPLMIPLIVTASFCLLKLKTVHASSALIAYVSRRPNMLNTQNGYSFLYKKDDIPKMAQQTIRFVAHQSINTHKVPIETWTPEKKAAAPMRRRRSRCSSASPASQACRGTTSCNRGTEKPASSS